MTTARLSREPLAEFACRRFAATNVEGRADSTPSCIDIARQLGISSRTWHRWAHEGLGFWRADEIAVSLGVHPMTIWLDWLDVSLEIDREDSPA